MIYIIYIIISYHLYNIQYKERKVQRDQGNLALRQDSRNCGTLASGMRGSEYRDRK